MTLPAHRIETTLDLDGTLVLEPLPFRAGQAVEVIVLPQQTEPHGKSPYPLRGTPVQFDRPTEPISPEDWDALE
jgi:hypothetical protein